MEIKQFLKVIKRNKIALILVPLVSVIITYFLVKNLPDVYKSKTRIATGLVDRSDAISGGSLPESQLNQEFANIIQTLQLKKTLNQVSYDLMIHDLTDKDPFRKWSKEVSALSAGERAEAITIYTQKLQTFQDLNLSNPKEKKLNELIFSMKYDPEKIGDKLLVYRVNNSDYIDVLYESEHPLLSSFVLNNLSKNFIEYHTTNIYANKSKAVAFLDSLTRNKQISLQKKMQALQNYKVKNGILNVEDQANTLIGQIADYENRKLEAQKNISAYSGALKNIDSKFDPTDRKYLESSVSQINQEIASTRDRLKGYNEEYLRSGFDSKYKPKIDSLNSVLSSKINQANDKHAFSPSSTKQDLVAQKLNMEVSLELAKNSVSSLQGELSRLNGKLYGLVPNQAVVQKLQADIDVESKEFLELSNRYNEARIESTYKTRLRQVELAMPGTYQPSKKILLVAVAGIASFVLCLFVLFALFFFDNSITDVRQLANVTQQPVIGSLNLYSGDTLDLKQVWDTNTDTEALKQFKNQLRALRFDIDNHLQHSKVLGITSLRNGEGKSFLALNLAFAYVAINKKVMLIDGNFENSTISDTIPSNMLLENYLNGKSDVYSIPGFSESLVVLGNKGHDTSLLEVSNASLVEKKLAELKSIFDVIIIETPSLNTHNRAKEWISFVDKLVPVIEANKSINDSNKDDIQYLNGINGKLIGWVLNKVKSGNLKNTKTASKTVAKKVSV